MTEKVEVKWKGDPGEGYQSFQLLPLVGKAVAKAAKVAQMRMDFMANDLCRPRC